MSTLSNSKKVSSRGATLIEGEVRLSPEFDLVRLICRKDFLSTIVPYLLCDGPSQTKARRTS